VAWQRAKALGHAKDRCHANAARKEKAFLRNVRQREVIFRRADLQQVTFVDGLMDRLRSFYRKRFGTTRTLRRKRWRCPALARMIAVMVGKSTLQVKWCLWRKTHCLAAPV
jgi:hypothetical protein